MHDTLRPVREWRLEIGTRPAMTAYGRLLNSSACYTPCLVVIRPGLNVVYKRLEKYLLDPTLHYRFDNAA